MDLQTPDVEWGHQSARSSSSERNQYAETPHALIHPARGLSRQSGWPGMTPQGARRVALAIGGLSGLLLGAGLVLWVLAILGAGKLIGLPSHQATIPISGVVLVGLGGMVFARHPRHPIAWILVGTGLLSGIELLNLGLLAFSSLKAPGQVIPAPPVSHWLAQWIWSPRGMIPLTFLLLLFPDGKLPSSRWRIVAWGAAVGLAGSTLADAFAPSTWEGLGGVVVNPFAIQSPLISWTQTVSGSLLGLGILASMASIFIRLRRSESLVRQQLKVMAYALGIVLVLLILAGVSFFVITDSSAAEEISYSIVNITIALVAIAVAIAVMRYRLYDIDLVINRTLVYGVLTVTVAGVYALTVGILGAIFQVRGNLLISLIAAGLIAVLFHPLQEALQRRVNRWLYGDRDEPYQVLSRLGRRLEGAAPTEAILATIVETVAQTLKLPYVAISLPVGGAEVIVSSVGQNTGNMVDLPLNYRSELVGNLLCSTRKANEPFTESETGLLMDIANQVAVAVYALKLSSDLQLSRQRLVSAREEERRRLRRDLHDGMGPQLASFGLKIDMARNELDRDPNATDEILKELRRQVRHAVGDLRGLVSNLRPPALDELGLLDALRASAAVQLSSDGLQVRIEGPDDLPALPAAVEVAVYRIVQEAVTNVARHAQAHHCDVRLRVNGGLELEIVDDGIGFSHPAGDGVGLMSMRERTAELGGEFGVEVSPKGGTRVVSRIPLATDTS